MIYGSIMDSYNFDVQACKGRPVFHQNFCKDLPPQNVSNTYTMTPCANANGHGHADEPVGAIIVTNTNDSGPGSFVRRSPTQTMVTQLTSILR